MKGVAPIKRYRIAALGLAGALTLATAAIVVAGPGERGPGNTHVPEAQTLVAKQVPSPGGGAAKARSRKVVFLETEPVSTIPEGPYGFIVKRCPRGAAAVNGYFFQRGTFEGFGLAEHGSSPVGNQSGTAKRPRKWGFYLENISGGPVNSVTFGLVCDHDG